MAFQPNKRARADSFGNAHLPQTDEAATSEFALPLQRRQAYTPAPRSFAQAMDRVLDFMDSAVNRSPLTVAGALRAANRLLRNLKDILTTIINLSVPQNADDLIPFKTRRNAVDAVRYIFEMLLLVAAEDTLIGRAITEPGNLDGFGDRYLLPLMATFSTAEMRALKNFRVRDLESNKCPLHGGRVAWISWIDALDRLADTSFSLCVDEEHESGTFKALEILILRYEMEVDHDAGEYGEGKAEEETEW